MARRVCEVIDPFWFTCYPRCPACGHPEGRHYEVLTFDEET